MIRHLQNLLKRQGPEAAVPLKWLAARPRRVGAKFAQDAKVEIIPDRDSFNVVKVNGKPYAWPATASIEHLLIILSEIELPNHPHQYLWGQTRIGPGDHVLDIGSCEGSFAALAAEMGAEVIAVEPSPMNQRMIRRLFELRGLPPARVAECALGTKSGTATLVEECQFPGYARVDGGTSATSQSVEVPVKTLDRLVEEMNLPRVDFIKCDAEGLDVDIIRSGEKTIERFHPRLAICTYHEDPDFSELAAFLSRFDYQIQGKGFLRTPDRFRPMMLHAW